jgi:hypothetical protein
MDSHRRRILDRMAAAERQLQRSPWADGPFADLQAAAADLHRIDITVPAQQATARRAHMAGHHQTPTIGTCPLCLDAYLKGAPSCC